MLIEYSYFPADLVPGMLDHDLSQSLYELLESKWSLAPVRKWETIEPSAATGWEQDLLRVGRVPNSPNCVKTGRIRWGGAVS